MNHQKMTIKTVIKTPARRVMVFDSRGEQMPEYQGDYSEVKAIILRDAPLDAIFSHWTDGSTSGRVLRETW